MAPPLVWLEMCVSEDMDNAHQIGVRPPLTKRRLIAAAAKVFVGISKQARIFFASSGMEIKSEVKSSDTEEMHVVVTLAGLDYVPRAAENQPLRCQDEVRNLDIDIRNADSQSEASNFPLSPMVRMGGLATSITECLSDDLLVRLSSFLSVPPLLAVGCSCRLWWAQVQACTQLWRSVCESVFGCTSLLTHEIAWRERVPSGELNDAFFYRQLIKASSKCSAFVHNSSLREHCLQTLPELSDMLDMAPLVRQKHMKHHFCVSGHTAVSMENLVAVIGGWRKRRLEQDIHLYVIDIADNLCMKQPVLTTDSFRPSRRLRHACCVVQASFLPNSAFQQKAILMLGGCHDLTQEPLPGLHILNLLTFTERDGSEARWFEVATSGNAPRSIWHHACGSFAKGKKVVVFGGDFPEADPEFAYIRDRFAASFVYVLNLELRNWERVLTNGLHPVWRSLHIGVVHESLRNATERLVVFGGSIEHTDIFSSGDAADMSAYALDLQTWTWLRGPSASEFHDLPIARMRIASERLGRFLLVYGGHSGEDADDVRLRNASEALLKLDLLTLSWGRCNVKIQASHYKSIASTTLASGIVFGGVQVKPNGISVVPNFDFLHLEPRL